MGQELNIKGHTDVIRQQSIKKIDRSDGDFALEKSIFSNIFEKDIRRVFIYKKCERLAKALHLIAPAFETSAVLRERIESLAIDLITSGVLPPNIAKISLSRDLLALSSILSVANSSGSLSSMNVEIISLEARNLLHEIAVYEEPRLFLDESPTLSGIAKNVPSRDSVHKRSNKIHRQSDAAENSIGQVKDTRGTDRREAVLSVIRNKPDSSIKDISTVIRGVSEKTIQRVLQALVEEKIVSKSGERRWSRYALT